MSNRLTTSADRLWKLIEERTQPDANVEDIDARIWDLFGQEWAVMMTDLAGFSRRTAQYGIIHFLQVIWEQQKLLFPVLERHDGLLVKTEADSLLVLFKRPQQAMRCAIELQAVTHQVNRRRKEEEQNRSKDRGGS